MSREAELLAFRQDLKRVARETHGIDDVAPSVEQYRQRGRYSHAKVIIAVAGYAVPGKRSRIEKWTKAVRKLGLAPFDTIYRPDDDVLMDDVRRVAQENGHRRRMPTTAEYREHGHYSVLAIQNRFGGWSKAARLMGLTPNKRGGDRRSRKAQQQSRAA